MCRSDLNTAQAAARREHACQLPEARLEVGHVPDPEPQRGHVVACIFERERHRVTANQRTSEDFGRGRARQHPLREVERRHLSPGREVRKRKIAGTAAGIQDTVAGNGPLRRPSGGASAVETLRREGGS